MLKEVTEGIETDNHREDAEEEKSPMDAEDNEAPRDFSQPPTNQTFHNEAVFTNPFHVPRLPPPRGHLYYYCHEQVAPPFYRYPLPGRFPHNRMRGEFPNRFFRPEYYDLASYNETSTPHPLPIPRQRTPTEENVRLDTPQNSKNISETNLKVNMAGDKPNVIIVKRHESEKPIGKLIPRQVSKRKVLPEGLLGKVTQTTRDSVNEELRRQAFVLGKF